VAGRGGYELQYKGGAAKRPPASKKSDAMELNGQVTIAAPRQRVWDALNDPAVLARCIDGVESLTRVEADDGERFEGKMNARVGPVRASFAGHVALTQVNAPERYVLVGEGKGGVAGFAKGEAVVNLSEPVPGSTLLDYQVTSSVGGKLAQLGARLIEGAAKGYADTFFTRLKAEIEVPEAEAAPVPDPEVIALATPATGLPPILWGGALVLIVLAFLVWQWGIH
jgi:carbon monoxide dehydrogenase subunit G